MTNTFELTAWGMNQCSAHHRAWLQAAWRHDLHALTASYDKRQPWSHVLVNPLHAFACGVPPSGGLAHARNVLAWLLDHNGDLNALDSMNWLPINYAAWFGNTTTMDVLLELGSPVHHPTAPQPLDTALDAVAQRQCIPSETCARLLLMHGADPQRGRARDMQYGGLTWLTWALEQERWDWAECLWAKGVRSISEKEIHLLINRGSAEALAWLQIRNINVLSHLHAKHPHTEKVIRAHAEHERHVLMNILIQSPETLHTDTDGGESGRRKL